MKSKKIDTFYASLINSKDEISKLFEEYIDEIKKLDINKIQSGFHELLDQTFETIRFNENEEGFEEALDMPESVKERVQITTLLFMMMTFGAKYSSELYQRVLNMRKELVTDNLIHT